MSAPAPETFEEGPPPAGPVLRVDLDGFEGPIDLLLSLAREQKVDLVRISILQLVDQYLDFMARAHALRLELAADYLVMAAWLAYLKSRLLLPEPERVKEDPDPVAMAEALAFQLRRLEAVRNASVRLMARPQLGEHVHGRGEPGDIETRLVVRYEASLHDLLTAYGAARRRTRADSLTIEPSRLYPLEAAVERLERMLGRMPEGLRDWRTLTSFLPRGLGEGVFGRSAVTALLSASLELAKSGRLKLRQDGPFEPIWLKQGEPETGES